MDDPTISTESGVYRLSEIEAVLTRLCEPPEVGGILISKETGCPFEIPLVLQEFLITRGGLNADT